jgi:YfiH family protein
VVLALTLPHAGAAFRWSREVWGAALRCVRIEPHAQHVFTSKQLQLRGADDATGWKHVQESAGGPASRVVRVKQVHGTTVHVVRAGEPHDGTAARPQADAIVSDVADALLAVQVADCVPMLVVDTRVGAAAAIHAGWRGTCAGIAQATVDILGREFDSRPDDLHVALGPSIGACCYEVGNELLAAFRAADPRDRSLARWFTRTGGGSLRLDLWTANRDQLVAAGVPPDRIHVARLCTQTHAHVFESYRENGPRAGRMIAAIRVPARRV